MLALIREIFDARQKTQAETKNKPDVVTRASHPDLAAAAKHARRQYHTGERLAFSVENNTRDYWDMTEWEMELHQRFHSGKLLREMVAANKAFGHGSGVEKSLSIEEMAALEMFMQGH